MPSLAHRLSCFAAVFLSLFAGPARGDYGSIPELQRLYLKVGGDFYRSTQNYITDGSLTDLLFQGQPVKFSDYRIWIEPEYGIAKDWSISARLNFESNTLNSQKGSGDALLTGSGIGDIWTSVKWGLLTSNPLLTAEVALKIPTYAMNPSLDSDLVLGDGDLAAAFRLHTGYQTGPLVLDLSPGFLARFGGYAPAITADGAIQLQFPRGYLRALVSFIYSIGNNLLFDTGANLHNAPGAGGTYARLSGSPVGVSAGGKLGVVIVHGFQLEGGVTQTVAGSRYPDLLQVSVNLFMTFDFFEPDKRKKIREVPLNERPLPSFYDQH